MDTVLRMLAQWKGRRKAAQVIIFDGGAEVERTRSFLKGAFTGIVLATGAFLLTAPTTTDGRMVEQVAERERLLDDTNQRLAQAVKVADVCLNTAQDMERTLDSYESFLGARAIVSAKSPAAN